MTKLSLLSLCFAALTAACAGDNETATNDPGEPDADIDSNDLNVSDGGDLAEGLSDAPEQDGDSDGDSFTDAANDVGPDVNPDHLEGPLRAELAPEMPRAAETLPGPDGLERTTAAAGLTGWGTFTFVENETVVVDSPAAIDNFAAASGATIWARHIVTADGSQEIALLRFEPADVSLEAMVDAIAPISAQPKGLVQVSSDAGADTIAAVALARGQGVGATLNFVLEFEGIADGDTPEASRGPNYNYPNDLAWTYMANSHLWPFLGPVSVGASPRTFVGSGVSGAWGNLALYGTYARGERVPVGVIDGGFAIQSGAIPRGRVEWSAVPWSAVGRPNSSSCTGGTPCPWHGTQVAQAIGAEIGDGFGGVGSAGGIAELSYYHVLPDAFGAVAAVAQAARDGQKVVNMSFTAGLVPIVFNWTLLPFDAALAVSATDMILVAAAGNDSMDVASGSLYAEIDLLTFWPCESQAVFCVGATDWDGDRRWFSNWSSISEGVDIFAPDGQLVYGITRLGDGPGTLEYAYGTSLSAPWVSGILALARTAGPGINPHTIGDYAMATSQRFPGAGFQRMIDANALILRVLNEVTGGFSPDSFTPSVRLVSPRPEPGAPYGTFEFEAIATQPFDHAGLGCCKYDWYTDGSEVLPSLPSFQAALRAATTEVWVVATNAFGLSATSERVPLNLAGYPPEVSVSLEGIYVPLGEIMVIVSGSDPNGEVLTCANVAVGSTPPVVVDTPFATTLSGDTFCERRMRLGNWASGDSVLEVRVTDAAGLTTRVDVPITITEAAEPEILITSPPVADVVYSTLGPRLRVVSVTSFVGSKRWYLYGADDDGNALVGLQLIGDNVYDVDLAAFISALDPALCSRPQGQSVALRVELSDEFGEVVASDQRWIAVSCPPG